MGIKEYNQTNPKIKTKKTKKYHTNQKPTKETQQNTTHTHTKKQNKKHQEPLPFLI